MSISSSPIRSRTKSRWAARILIRVAVCTILPECTYAAFSESQYLETVKEHCVPCHNDRALTGNLSLEGLDPNYVVDHAEVWEKVVKKLRAGAMPPAGVIRLDDSIYSSLLTHLETELDLLADQQPNPGRAETFRRLSRVEYQNSIRDLLALEIDVTSLLPRDDSSFGFDNVNSGGLSPTLMERYLSAGLKVSRLAVGSRNPAAGSRVVVVPADRTQEDHLDGLPFGTRGGLVVSHMFPADGKYEIQVRLQRNRNENVEGLTEPHDVEITLDGSRIKVFTMEPVNSQDMVKQANSVYYADVGIDNHLNVSLSVSAGPHVVGASFLKKNSSLVETARQPYQARFNMDRHPRQQPAVRTLSIAGPFDPTGVSETPSRKQIFSCRPETELADDAEACATTIVEDLMRRAYRRPVTKDDLDQVLPFYRKGYASGGFEFGVETALRALLTSPEFLFRIERDPEKIGSGVAYRVSNLELASRLSFFLWSSLPDDELLQVAMANGLSDSKILEMQVRRMLTDPRAEALTTNFAAQWLYLRNLDAVQPDARLFPDFDDNLRLGFRRETELFFRSILREDRSALDLLTADYTYLNERLAKHYELPYVYGDHFRRVSLPDGGRRVGLLGHGSILTVTSYATRTSPVMRGKWVLENLLGTPPPPPPANVPPLDETRSNTHIVSMRDRMESHRRNPACAVCHRIMDPAGLSMENFDAIGRWRDVEGATVIDSTGRLPGGVDFNGVSGLRNALLERPEVFVGTLTEKLLIYALGRGLGHADAPAVRAIVRSASNDGYRLSSLVLGVVQSTPFQMRRSQS